MSAAQRALIGGGVLAAWIALRGRQPASRRQDADLSLSQAGRSGLPSTPLLIALALTNATLAFGAMYLAAGQSEAAVASILAGGQPLVLAAAGWALFGEPLSGRTVAGLAVAMAGVVVVATTSSGATSLHGVALALLATVAPAAGTILMRKLGPNVDLLATTNAQFLLGGAILLAVSALLEPWGAIRWSPAMLAWLLVLGMLGTGLAYVAWFWLLNRVSLVRLGATSSWCPWWVSSPPSSPAIVRVPLRWWGSPACCSGSASFRLAGDRRQRRVRGRRDRRLTTRPDRIAEGQGSSAI